MSECCCPGGFPGETLEDDFRRRQLRQSEQDIRMKREAPVRLMKDLLRDA